MLKKLIISTIILFCLAVSTWQISKSRNFQFFGELIPRLETDTKIVALTFDDGPSNLQRTNDVIATLDKLNIKGTFFLNGSNIERNLTATKNLITAGHDIGNHSYSHHRMVFMAMDKVKNEVDSTTNLIREAGYEGTIYFRPPYGKKLFTLPYYLANQDIITVTWDVEPESYKDIKQDSQLIADHVLDSVKPGSIILLHALGSNNKASQESIPLIVNGLHDQGFEFVTLSKLLNQ